MDLHKYLTKQGWGAVTALAKGIKAPAPDVSNWAKGTRPCPPWRCIAIEKYTNGEVTRKDLRPHDYKKHWPDLAYDH